MLEIGRGERIAIGTGLITAVVAGAGAGGFDSAAVQSLLYAVSSLGWVTATGILALRHTARSEFVVATGFLLLTIAEPLLWVNGRPGDPSYEAGFAGGVMFYVPGLVMLAASGVYHLFVRVFAALGAGVWTVGSIRYLADGSLAHTDQLAVAGYALLSVAFMGVAVALLRKSRPFDIPIPNHVRETGLTPSRTS